MFAVGDTHALLITVQLRKGGARTLTETIKTAACATRYTAGQWKTNVGTGLRLRVDSRTALSSVTFPLTAKLAGHGALKAQKGLGRLRFVQAGGVRTILQLGATKGAPKGVLLPAATPRRTVRRRQWKHDHRSGPPGRRRDRRAHALPPRRQAAAGEAAPDGSRHRARGRPGQAQDQASARHWPLTHTSAGARRLGGGRAPVTTFLLLPM